jgi:very-short-patch-repair endonuclease
VDGGQHAASFPKDQRRTQYLESQGYRVLRFWNTEVLLEVDGVLTAILGALEKSPSP